MVSTAFQSSRALDINFKQYEHMHEEAKKAVSNVQYKHTLFPEKNKRKK